MLNSSCHSLRLVAKAAYTMARGHAAPPRALMLPPDPNVRDEPQVLRSPDEPPGKTQ